MAVLYESKRFPVAFNRVDVGGRDLLIHNQDTQVAYPVLSGPRNGSIATSRSMSALIENLHWLAMRDTPMVNFFEVAGNGDNSPSATSWTNSSKTIKVLLPPFCRWASFHFLCARDMGDTTQALSYIQVASGVHTVVNTSIPWGEDLTATSKSGLSYYSADWIHFVGTDLDETGGPSALRILDDSTDKADWTHESITITVSPRCNVYAAAYRVLPAFGTLQVQS